MSEVFSVAVLGAGAMGSVYGGKLAQAGCKVALISRNRAYREAVNTRGLTLEIAGQSTLLAPETSGGKLLAVPDLQSAPPPDLLLVLVKSQDTQNSLAACAPYIPPTCTVLTLQNGLGNIETIARYVPEERLLGGISYISAALRGPGEVVCPGIKPSIFACVAAAQGKSHLPQTAERIRALFERAELPCSVTDNLWGAIWKKFMVNMLANALSALTRLSYGQLLAAEESAWIMSALLEEGRAVAAKKGVRLELDAQFLEKLRQGAPAAQSIKPSTLQDVLAGRKTEIMALNGALAREGKALGVPTPFNSLLTSLVLMLEKSYL